MRTRPAEIRPRAGVGACHIRQFRVAPRMLKLLGVMAEDDTTEDLPSLTLRLLRKIDERLDHIEQRMDRMEQRMDRMEQRMDQMEKRMDQMDVRMRLMHEDIFTLRTHVQMLDDRMSSRVAALESRVGTLESEMRGGFAAVMHVLSTSWAGIDARVTRLETT